MKASRYNYKYLPDTSYVYVVTQKKRHVTLPLYSRKQAFLAKYVDLRARNEQRHVVIGFSNESMLHYKLPKVILEERDLLPISENELLTKEDIDTEIHVHVTRLRDMKAHCSMMRMPLLIYMNAYCNTHDNHEEFDTYFYENREPNPMSLFKGQ